MLDSIIGKVVGFNLFVLLLETFVLFIISFIFPIFNFGMLLIVFFHVITCFILFLVNLYKKQNDYASGYLLSSVSILLIGSSACFGASAILNQF